MTFKGEEQLQTSRLVVLNSLAVFPQISQSNYFRAVLPALEERGASLPARLQNLIARSA